MIALVLVVIFGIWWLLKRAKISPYARASIVVVLVLAVPATIGWWAWEDHRELESIKHEVARLHVRGLDPISERHTYSGCKGGPAHGSGGRGSPRGASREFDLDGVELDEAVDRVDAYFADHGYSSDRAGHGTRGHRYYTVKVGEPPTTIIIGVWAPC